MPDLLDYRHHTSACMNNYETVCDEKMTSVKNSPYGTIRMDELTRDYSNESERRIEDGNFVFSMRRAKGYREGRRRESLNTCSMLTISREWEGGGEE